MNRSIRLRELRQKRAHFIAGMRKRRRGVIASISVIISSFSQSDRMNIFFSILGDTDEYMFGRIFTGTQDF